jgi:hypothetical protein
MSTDPMVDLVAADPALRQAILDRFGIGPVLTEHPANRGRCHAERRAAQAAAARRHTNRARAAKRPGKGTRAAQRRAAIAERS